MDLGCSSVTGEPADSVPDPAPRDGPPPILGTAQGAGRGDFAQASRLSDFQALVRGYQSAIFRVAYRLTGNCDDAEDLVQESLVEAFLAFDRFRAGTRFDQWVYRIMTRNYIDGFRRQRRLSSVSLDEITEEREMPEFADSTSDPQEVIERTVWSEPVQAALDRLAPEFRAAVVLCDAQGMSYEDASRALGCPVGTIRSRLHRARHQLRECLCPKASVVRGE